MLTNKNIVIIGAGNMGEVLVRGIISGRLVSPENITVADIVSERLNFLQTTYRIQTAGDNREAVTGADIVILAVKPQSIQGVLGNIADVIAKTTLVISIAAGVTLEVIEGCLGTGCRAIRVMPNTPALIGEGATALAGGRNIGKADMETARRIFDSVGITITVGEELMDAVTGLSGSGPAYGFIIIEALTDAGVKMGLSRDVALRLSAQTMLGAARLCLAGDKTPSQLKDMVTSPGGTTIEGIKALESGKLRATLMDAVEAATLRSKALGAKKK